MVAAAGKNKLFISLAFKKSWKKKGYIKSAERLSTICGKVAAAAAASELGVWQKNPIKKAVDGYLGDVSTHCL